jgi:uncharacterized repeat protein (TIGR01451 family)
LRDSRADDFSNSDTDIKSTISNGAAATQRQHGAIRVQDVPLGPDADLRMVVGAAPTAVAGGQPVAFLLTVNNAGPNAASNLVVTFAVPAQSSLVGSPLGDGWTCQVAQGAVRCTLPMLASRGIASAITVTVLPELGATSVTGTAEVSSDGADPNPADNSASAVVPIDPSAYMQALLVGGGFGCSQAALRTASPSGLLALVGLGVAAGLTLFRGRGRRRQSRVSDGN